MRTSVFVLLLVLPNFFFAQSIELELPRVSQAASVTQRIGLTDITVNFHRPGVKGRTVWGDLVPYDGGNPIPWRAGANENTTITISTDVMVEGQALKAGTYGLHMIPSEKEVIVIFSNDYQSWGSFSYNEDHDALRVTVKPEPAPFQEWLSYEFEPTDDVTTVCRLHWAERAVPFSIQADREMVLASVREQLKREAGWTWRGWYEAANYCLQNKFNYQEAIGWVSRSVWAEPNFQNIRAKAELMASQKGLEGAEYEQAVLDQMEQELMQEPADWKAWDRSANFSLTQYKDADRALAWADLSLDQYATFANANTKSDALRAMGKDKEADKLMDKMIASAGNYDLNKYGYQLLFSGKRDKAIEILTINANKHPEDPNVWDSLGEAYFKTGDKENAEKYLRKCLSMKPTDFLANHAKGILAQMGVEVMPD